MAWIESHQSLRSHPKTKRFARSLEIDLATAIGHLHCLWWWALDYAQDGSLASFEDWEIADASLWIGDPGRFVAALQEASFLDERTLHDWDEYAGRLISARVRNRERMAAWRNRKSDDQGSTEGRNAYVNVTTKGNRTVPNHTNPTQPNKPTKGAKSRTSAIIPEDWEPDDESLEWSTAQGWNPEWVRRHTETFRDYYLGTGKPMKNWKATWRNWLRRSAQRDDPKQVFSSRPQSANDWLNA